MFILRFFAGPIIHKISPLGLMFASTILAAIGLTMLGHSDTAIFCIAAATVYAIGKTFMWPTLLAVSSELFPKGGAITIGAMGGAGMLCAGLLGGPGIGYNQDTHATRQLMAEHPDVFNRYKADNQDTFFVFKTQGLDGSKVGVLDDNGQELAAALKLQIPDDANNLKLTRVVGNRQDHRRSRPTNRDCGRTARQQDGDANYGGDSAGSGGTAPVHVALFLVQGRIQASPH